MSAAPFQTLTLPLAAVTLGKPGVGGPQSRYQPIQNPLWRCILLPPGAPSSHSNPLKINCRNPSSIHPHDGSYRSRVSRRRFETGDGGYCNPRTRENGVTSHAQRYHKGSCVHRHRCFVGPVSNGWRLHRRHPVDAAADGAFVSLAPHRCRARSEKKATTNCGTPPLPRQLPGSAPGGARSIVGQFGLLRRDPTL